MDGNTVLFAQHFNKPLDLNRDVPFHITALIFGKEFNQPIVLAPNMVRLTFEYWYVHPIRSNTIL